MKEKIQERLEREFNVYKEQVLTLGKQSIFDKSYETAIKQEISLFFAECAEDDMILEFLDKFPASEVLLDYLYDLWIDADSRIGGEIFDTLKIELQQNCLYDLWIDTDSRIGNEIFDTTEIELQQKLEAGEISGKIVLIDGHSIINRAFYGLPDLTNSEGMHTNGVYGFLNIMFKILDEEKPDYLTVAFDVSEPTFRHKIYPEYKGTRKKMPDELAEQVPVLQEVLKAMNISIVMQGGFEADDILGTIAKKAENQNIEVTLVSGDRDLLQLASETIKISIPKTKKGGSEVEEYHTQAVID
ncbi:MAG: DUF3848 domain-containing protein, partial [Lachnospiraceae bacterium]|nr:DUF3848 domain-containing protein [Lachnospiraceae bacterium]